MCTSRSEEASELKPFHVATTPRLLFFFASIVLTHKGSSLSPSLCLPDAPASGVSSVWQVTGWRCDSCPYAIREAGQSRPTHTGPMGRTSTGVGGGIVVVGRGRSKLHCRASTEEVRPRRPPPSPNFKCHAQLSGAL